MTRKSKAFTLVQLVVYTALFSCVVLLASCLVCVVFSTLGQLNRAVHESLSSAVVLDRVWRDVIMTDMSELRCDWDHGVFTKQYIDQSGKFISTAVGWEACALKNNQQGLCRSEGVYDFARHQWQRRTTSVIASSITSLRFFNHACDKQQHIICVRIEYGLAHQVHNRSLFARIRNRVII
jgi:hypothetical protein